MLISHYSQIDGAKWPFKWFQPHELACKGTGELLVDFDAVSRLDWLRHTLGRPVIITSAYRSALHNARVGGAPKSMHKQGRAFDIVLAGHNRSDLVSQAKQAGFTGFGYYNTFLHVDTGRARRWGKQWS